MTHALVNKVKLIDDRDMVIRASIDGQFEADTFKFVDHHMPVGGLFMDIGAYSGIYSLYVAQFKDAVAYGFEPNPLLFERFNQNIELNGLRSNIQPLNFGLSNKQQKASLYVNPNTHLTSAGSLSPERGKTSVFEVDIEVYDDMPFSVLSIDMVKIDVEGHESQVIEGMIYTLKRDHPIVIVECLDEQAVKQCDDLLLPLGYERTGCLDDRNYTYQ